MKVINVYDQYFAVSYGAYAAKELYNAKGRRSKKREAEYLEIIRARADELAQSLGGLCRALRVFISDADTARCGTQFYSSGALLRRCCSCSTISSA